MTTAQIPITVAIYLTTFLFGMWMGKEGAENGRPITITAIWFIVIYACGCVMGIIY